MKKTLDKLQLAREIVEKHFSIEEENYGLFVCGCFCLLQKYDDIFFSLVEKFISTYFLGSTCSCVGFPCCVDYLN